MEFDWKALWETLLVKELKAKYKNTFLGYAWSVILPLFQSVVFFMVFSFFLRFPIQDYFLYLSIGFVVWQFFSNALTQGANVLAANRSIICRTRVPRWILIFANVSAEAFHLLVSLPILLILMLFCGRSPDWSIIWYLPAGVISVFLMANGIAMIVGLLNSCFRDLERIIQILLMVWFYVTPVFYGPFQLPEEYRWLLELNCVYYPVEIFRSAFYEPAASLRFCFIALIYGAVIQLAGIFIFSRGQRKLPEVL